MDLRTDIDTEMQGLDPAEHAELGYGEWGIPDLGGTKSSSTPTPLH